MILVTDVLSNVHYVPKRIVKGLKFDNKSKRYYVESYVYDKDICVSKSVVYVDKHEVFCVQRIPCMVLSLLSRR